VDSHSLLIFYCCLLCHLFHLKSSPLSCVCWFSLSLVDDVLLSLSDICFFRHFLFLFRTCSKYVSFLCLARIQNPRKLVSTSAVSKIHLFVFSSVHDTQRTCITHFIWNALMSVFCLFLSLFKVLISHRVLYQTNWSYYKPLIYAYSALSTMSLC